MYQDWQAQGIKNKNKIDPALRQLTEGGSGEQHICNKSQYNFIGSGRRVLTTVEIKKSLM